MFFKKFKSILLTILLTFNILPISTYAYSDYIIASGKNIGIEIKSNGIMVVGFYKIDNISPGKDAKMQLGDKITKINNKDVNSINEMVSIISNTDSNSLNITYLRDNKEYVTNLSLIKSDDNIYKTGLFVKDTINGIGTLTFIDPETNMYGALGHEIVDKNTALKIEVKDGKIYQSKVTGITKSTSGTPGEKNATYNSNIVFGTLDKNTKNGIFGKYKSNIENNTLYEVGNIDEIDSGPAHILTVLNEETVESFDISIIKTNKNNTGIKNILFEITDEKLLQITGGVVQGMSGSPIIQNNKIIGAVTHVVVDNPKRGYGVFITNMLEEMEK